MVIQHNMSAINSNMQLNNVNNMIATNMEKLSSGYKINRAADDAAGLSISEKMRWQIRGLNKACQNAQDGQSLISVVDGALNEMHDILQRMNELATQAANDTNTDEDREALQKEISQLQKEVNRISEDTEFNTIPVLSTIPLVEIDAPDYSHVALSKPVNVGGKNYSRSESMDFAGINEKNRDQLVGKTFRIHCSQGCLQEFVFSFTDSEASEATISGSATRPNINVKINVNDFENGSQLVKKIYDLTETKKSDIENAAAVQDPNLPPVATYIGHDNGMTVQGSKLIVFALDNSGAGYIEAAELALSDRVLNLQVGAQKDQNIEITLKTMNCDILGIEELDVSNHTAAGETMEKVQNAINGVSEYRSYLGALENRLEYTMDNLMNTSENTQRAESSIRDTDMAEVMENYRKNSILAQASLAMIAQVNQNAQNVLALLG